MSLFAKDIKLRMHHCIDLAWDAFQHKVASGQIVINKEASMQLHYSAILNQLIPIIQLDNSEHFDITLESTFRNIKRKNREVDIVFSYKKKNKSFSIAIELKCYREWSDKEAGRRRGATDIFKKDVYEDIELVELYINNKHVNDGLCLVMTDYKGFIYPSEKSRNTKSWKTYDISPKTKTISKGTYKESIGGKNCNIKIRNNYNCSWIQTGDFWFLKLKN